MFCGVVAGYMQVVERQLLSVTDVPWPHCANSSSCAVLMRQKPLFPVSGTVNALFLCHVLLSGAAKSVVAVNLAAVPCMCAKVLLSDCDWPGAQGGAPR
jgi:Mrp family chromosome partitioning ATPase